MSEESESGKKNANERNLGVQPLDAIMAEQGWGNHDVVAASLHPLTHKAVQRARSGRRLTIRTMRHVTEAVNRCLQARGRDPLVSQQLFNYKPNEGTR
jgi:hypothetical protein